MLIPSFSPADIDPGMTVWVYNGASVAPTQHVVKYVMPATRYVELERGLVSYSVPLTHIISAYHAK